jgi:hypothetical protein
MSVVCSSPCGTPSSTHGDHFMHLADLKSYLEADHRLIELYTDPEEWSRKSDPERGRVRKVLQRPNYRRVCKGDLERRALSPRIADWSGSHPKEKPIMNVSPKGVFGRHHPRNAVTADEVGRGRRDGEVVETIEGMKDSRSGLLPDHNVINYNSSSIPLAAREASTYMRITLGSTTGRWGSMHSLQV